MKVISFALFLLSVAVLTSCDMRRTELLLTMSAEGDSCPKPAGRGMTQTKAELNDTCVLFVVEYDEEMYPTSQFEHYAKEIRSQLIDHINVRNLDCRTPLHAIADNAKHCQIPLVWIYESNATHKQTIVRVAPEQICGNILK